MEYCEPHHRFASAIFADIEVRNGAISREDVPKGIEGSLSFFDFIAREIVDDTFNVLHCASCKSESTNSRRVATTVLTRCSARREVRVGSEAGRARNRLGH